LRKFGSRHWEMRVNNNNNNNNYLVLRIFRWESLDLGTEKWGLTTTTTTTSTLFWEYFFEEVWI
jgi:hypothetical protein